MKKSERLDLILNVIKEKEISNQEELTETLNEYGCNVSQATVSRDITELGLIKVSGVNKKSKYFHAASVSQNFSKKNIDLFKHVTTSIIVANNLVVVKTLSGNGSSAGYTIDSMHIQQILGTIAGDDTLVIIAKNNTDAEIISQILRAL